MTRKFSWEPLDGGSLLLKVTDGDREITWKLSKTASLMRKAAIMNEVHTALVGDLPISDRLKQEDALTATLSGLLIEKGGAVQADTEEASKAALKAKADAVSAKGGAWWQKDSYEDDLVYTIGHGADEEA